MDEEEIKGLYLLARMEQPSDKIPDYDVLKGFKSSTFKGWHLFAFKGDDVVDHVPFFIGKGKEDKERDIKAIINRCKERKMQFLDSMPPFERKAIENKWREQLKVSIPYKVFKQNILNYIDGFMIDDIVKSRIVQNAIQPKNQPLFQKERQEAVYNFLCSPQPKFSEITPLIPDCSKKVFDEVFNSTPTDIRLIFNAPNKYYLPVLFHKIASVMTINKRQINTFLEQRFENAGGVTLSGNRPLKDWKAHTPPNDVYIRYFEKIATEIKKG